MHFSPAPMHIPDGFLSVWVALLFWAVSIPAVWYALRRVGRDLGERQVPLMGVLAAAVFAGQMLNFTVAGGTSGHLMGAALTTILLGPWGAILVLTNVVGVQALIFQDGGLLALGANLFNMAVVGVAVAHMANRTVQRLAGRQPWGLFVGGFMAAWLSTETAALSVALQLALSGTSPANIAIPAMAAVHALIGIGEGLICVGALAFLYATRRDLLASGAAGAAHDKLVWLAGLALALVLAIASPLASTHPDGLERVALQYGFFERAQGYLYQVVPDYSLPGVADPRLATILAGVLGTLLVFGTVLAVTYTRRRRRTQGA